jgi:hypothetical protein
MPCFDEGLAGPAGVPVHRRISNTERCIAAAEFSQPTFDHLSALPRTDHAAFGRNEAEDAVVLNSDKWAMVTQQRRDRLAQSAQVGRAALGAKCETDPCLVEIASSPLRTAAGLLCAAEQEKAQQPWRRLDLRRVRITLSAVHSWSAHAFCRGVGSCDQHAAVAVRELGRWSNNGQVARRCRWRMHSRDKHYQPG